MKYLKIRQKASVVTCLLMLLAFNISTAQDIAVLPTDPAIKSGVLPNGTKWYAVSNPYIKGVADFALVQMTGSETTSCIDRQTAVSLAQAALWSHPVLLSPTVQDYFVARGAVPGPEGFAEVGRNTTVFRFRNVDLKQSESALDSTLLVLTNMTGGPYDERHAEVKKWYAPSDQAIIVAGDIDVKSVSEKLRMLSYMVPALESQKRPEYRWVEQEVVVVDMGAAPVEGISQLKATWRLQRTPRELMNTVVPAVYKRYMTMAGLVAQKRIAAALKTAGISAISVESSYAGGAGTIGDEHFSVSVKVASEHAEEALTAIAGVMSSMDAFGADVQEIRSAGYAFADALYAADRDPDVSNREYLDRCICSFVYNTPLSSKKNIRDFYASREIDDETECRIFHSIISSSIDSSSNLSLAVNTDRADIREDAVKSWFAGSWKEAAVDKPVRAEIPAPLLETAPEAKVKIKSSKKEYLSKGKMLTLANGIKVIYKEMPSEDALVHFSLALNGGTGSIEGLCPEDGECLADFFNSCSIGGVSGSVFKETVRRHGMVVDCKVGHSCTEFKGRVPEEELEYMFRVLLTMLNSRKADSKEWKFCHVAGHGACMDAEFARRADSFFENISGKINDGVLVLVGKIDERVLKNTVTAYAGGFRTSDRAFSRTQTYNGRMTGLSGTHRKGSTGNIDMHISAPMPMTMEKYYASSLAAMVLRRNLAAAVSEMGVRTRVSHECRRHPQEILALEVSLTEIPVDGLAAGTYPYDKADAMAAVRKVISDLDVLQIDEDLLKLYRYRLERQLQMEKEKPEYWQEALRLRYMEGKDFTTGAEATIKAITRDDVKKILDLLDKGTKVEYEITEK